MKEERPVPCAWCGRVSGVPPELRRLAPFDQGPEGADGSMTCPACGAHLDCYVVNEDGYRYLIPVCMGAAIGGAARCTCTPRPRGVEAMARREWAEDQRLIRARDAREQAELERLYRNTEEWVAAGGRPRLLEAS